MRPMPFLYLTNTFFVWGDAVPPNTSVDGTVTCNFDSPLFQCGWSFPMSPGAARFGVTSSVLGILVNGQRNMNFLAAKSDDGLAARMASIDITGTGVTTRRLQVRHGYVQADRHTHRQPIRNREARKQVGTRTDTRYSQAGNKSAI